jgi:cytochrome c peroxidase
VRVLKALVLLPMGEVSHIVSCPRTVSTRIHSSSIAVVALMTVFMLVMSMVSVAQIRVGKTAFRLPDVPQPAGNKSTPQRIGLGKMLFFDSRLSGSSQISCATCHDPALDWSDGLPTARGNNAKVLRRGTPSLLNSAFNHLQMWDGRFHSLEEQVTGPILSADEMNGSMDQVLAKLKSTSGYVDAFEKAYPGEGITPDTLRKAIACFERTLVSRSSPFDHWISGNQTAISSSAKRGFRLFVGKADCVVCHQPPNFTDEGFHNIGLKNDHDNGRFEVVPIKAVKGGFKTPSLRGVTGSSPYMHNGVYATLEEVIDHYDRGGDDKQNLDPNMKPLNLTSREKGYLLEFLKSLSTDPVSFTLPVLPSMQETKTREMP